MVTKQPNLQNVQKVADDSDDQEKDELLASRELDPLDDAIIGVPHGVLKSECSGVVVEWDWPCCSTGVGVNWRWCLVVGGVKYASSHPFPALRCHRAPRWQGHSRRDSLPGEKLGDRFWDEDNNTILQQLIVF